MSSLNSIVSKTNSLTIPSFKNDLKQINKINEVNT